MESVANSVESIIMSIRTEQRPAFLRANCIHLEVHFLGDPLLRFKRTPIKQLRAQEAGLKFKYCCVCTDNTIPYAR